MLLETYLSSLEEQFISIYKEVLLPVQVPYIFKTQALNLFFDVNSLHLLMSTEDFDVC